MIILTFLKEEFELPTLNVGSFDTGFGVKEFTLITEPQLYFVMMRCGLGCGVRANSKVLRAGGAIHHHHHHHQGT